MHEYNGNVIPLEGPLLDVKGGERQNVAVAAHGREVL